MNNVILVALVTSLALQALFFAFASSLKTDKLTDLSYSLTFAVITAVILFVNSSPSVPHFILAGLVFIWAARLGGYLLIRIIKTKKDKRFDGIRENFFKFAQFWFFQGIAVFLIMLPAIFVLSSKISTINEIFIIFGTIIWLVGFAVETTSDIQKYKFKSNPKNKGKWIQNGIWKYSRHPNYFGEILIWWGIFIFSIPYLKGITYLSLIGPVFITYILLYVTGIPPLEKSYDERYKKNKEYRKYKKQTSILIPLPKLKP